MTDLSRGEWERCHHQQQTQSEEGLRDVVNELKKIVFDGRIPIIHLQYCIALSIDSNPTNKVERKSGRHIIWVVCTNGVDQSFILCGVKVMIRSSATLWFFRGVILLLK